MSGKIKNQYQLRGHGPDNIENGLITFRSVDPSTSADTYGNGEIINDFESEMAALLGKPGAVFFPSGTMAQQIALRIWSDKAGNAFTAYHPKCHLEIHEESGLKELHHLTPYLLGETDRLFTLRDLEALPDVASVLFELPQREIGGQLPTWQELIDMTQYCRSRGFALHLDGARLLETLPYYQKTAAEVAALFNSVYISFYKGLGGITGAVLAGPEDFLAEAKIWKRRHGGDLYHLYPYTISAKYYYDLRKSNFTEYWQYAVDFARQLSILKDTQIIPPKPVCNMFHIHFKISADELNRKLIMVQKELGILLLGSIHEKEDGTCFSEMWLGDRYRNVPKNLISDGIKRLAELLQ